MLEDNAIWLVYLWGIYPQVGNLVETLILIGGAAILLYTVFRFVMADDINWKKADSIAKPLGSIWLALIFLNSFTPNRNTLIMMLSAKPIIQTAKQIGDSSTTKSLVNILDNSVKYLEKQSEELAK